MPYFALPKNNELIFAMLKMNELIELFPTHLKEAIKIGQSHRFEPAKKSYHNVVISGLGGSGIGGKIISQMVANEMSIPVVTNNDYHLPNFANEHTLVIVSSYSGNTEETLSAMEIALERNCEVACITSGGKVLEMAQSKGLQYIQIPGGLPPRASFGLNSPQLLYILHYYGLISDAFENKINQVADRLTNEEEKIRAQAQELSKGLLDHIPIIYSSPSYEGVGVRFRQQLNENSKMLCWHAVLPEMNHNELVGWAGGDEKFAVVMFRTEDDYSRTQLRMNLSKTIFKKHTDRIFEIHAKGDNIIERSYYLINVGDWISYYLAEQKDIDPVEVKVIDFLKSELAKH